MVLTLRNFLLTVLITLASAFGAHGACLFSEAASPFCSAPRVIAGSAGQHVVLMDVSTSTSTASMACTGLRVGNVVYFRVTPQVTGYMTVSTCHPMTLYDTVLEVLKGDCEFLAQVACNDDSTDAYCDSSCSSRPSKVRF